MYRGPDNSLPDGTYIYGDYCTGEMFAWDGRSQSVLLNAGGAISSFGEDEDGELYVVTLKGTTLVPAVQDFGSTGGSATILIGNASGCSWRQPRRVRFF